MSLLEIGHEVIGFDLKPFPVELPEGYEHIIGDLLNSHAKRELSRLQWGVVYHLATSSDMSASFLNPENYLRYELSKTKSLLELSANRPESARFIFASSCSVYGDIMGDAASETNAFAPQSPYAMSKIQSERAIKTFVRETNLSSGVFRFFNVIGASQEKGLKENHQPETHILPKLVQAASNSETFEVYGRRFDTKDGTAIRDYVDVRDICTAMVIGDSYLRGLPGSQQTWNLGSNLGLSVLDLVSEVESVMNRKVNLSFLEARAGDPARALASSIKARQELGWRPRHSLESSIRSIMHSEAGDRREFSN